MLRQILPLALLCVVALSGCPNNTAPEVYSIADWQVRCDSEMLSCTPAPPRQVTGFNGGAAGNSVSCSVMEGATDRVVTARTGSSAGGVRYSISLTNARVPRGGGFAATGCSVRVEEGANTYSGSCGALAPSATQPCQVQITFGTDAMTGSTILNAEVLCDHLPNIAAPTQLRSVFASAGSAEPGLLQFFDCRGLSRDM